MNKKALVVCAFVTMALAYLTVPPASQPPVTGPDISRLEPNGTCSDVSTAITDEADPLRVPPGCCTSNCNTNKDCDKICGKGNCACIATSSCCRRCTY